MKKKVKALIIAASIAAIAGIGAVSFAQWQGNGKETIGTTGSLGTVTTVGFTNDTALTWSAALVPQDQPDATIATGQKLVSVTLPTFTAVNGQKITVEVKTIKVGENNYEVATDKKNDLYVLYATETKTLADVYVAGNKYTSTMDVATFSATTTVNSSTIYFALDSDDIGAQGAAYTIEVKLANPTND